MSPSCMCQSKSVSGTSRPKNTWLVTIVCLRRGEKRAKFNCKVDGRWRKTRRSSGMTKYQYKIIIIIIVHKPNVMKTLFRSFVSHMLEFLSDVKGGFEGFYVKQSTWCRHCEARPFFSKPFETFPNLIRKKCHKIRKMCTNLFLIRNKMVGY